MCMKEFLKANNSIVKLILDQLLQDFEALCLTLCNSSALKSFVAINFVSLTYTSMIISHFHECKVCIEKFVVRLLIGSTRLP